MSIINGIKMYSAEDAEICLFGKVLRNEIDEDNKYLLVDIKSTITELLNYYLKNRYPLKSVGEIKRMVANKQMGEVTEDEWNNVINYLYEKDDIKQLKEKLMVIARKRFEKIKSEKRSK